jgi:hypothetical protein
MKQHSLFCAKGIWLFVLSLVAVLVFAGCEKMAQKPVVAEKKVKAERADEFAAEKPVARDGAARDNVAVQTPRFPWPPPQASARADIPDKLLRHARTEKLALRDIDRRLSAALDAAGYAEKSYFAVPDGFALVTRLEQIEADGAPKKKESDRWATEPGRLREFSLSAYLKALFTSNVGHFRVIVFVVTSRPFSQAEAMVSRDEALAWFPEGLNRLPDAIGRRPYTAQYASTALIYEFEKSDVAKQAQTKIPGRLTGRTHLERAGVWGALQRE